MSVPASPRPIIGLTGGIGSGKSAAAEHFASLGADIVDTDAISHALTAPGGRALTALRQRFGASIFSSDGSLDRAVLRQRVFSDTQERRALEDILHPMIRSDVGEALASARGPYAILVVPLLVESGAYRGNCQRVLVVDCSEETQIARTMQRSHLSAEQVRAIMAAQATRAQRLAAADDVIDNDGTLTHLHRQVETLHSRYLTLAAA